MVLWCQSVSRLRKTDAGFPTEHLLVRLLGVPSTIRHDGKFLGIRTRWSPAKQAVLIFFFRRFLYFLSLNMNQSLMGTITRIPGGVKD